MNTEILKKIADILRMRKFPDQVYFSMNNFIDTADEKFPLPVHDEYGEQIEIECGTTMCIGGWACYLAGEKSHVKYRSEVAQKYLDLDEETAHSLFYPNHSGTHFTNDEWEGVTPERAATVIDHLITTGTVDWDCPEANEGDR